MRLNINPDRFAGAFGLIGVGAAAILPEYLVTPSNWTFIVLGLGLLGSAIQIRGGHVILGKSNLFQPQLPQRLSTLQSFYDEGALLAREWEKITVRAGDRKIEDLARRSKGWAGRTVQYVEQALPSVRHAGSLFTVVQQNPQLQLPANSLPSATQTTFRYWKVNMPRYMDNLARLMNLPQSIDK